MIKAEVIAHSESAVDGSTIATFSLEYPRLIHSELLTHRLFSRNAASSRAIPFEKQVEQVRNNPAMPEEWGLNQSGMQAKEVLCGHKKETAIWQWKQAAKAAANEAEKLNDLGLHKQIVNRVLEPFVHMKTVLTATEFANYWWLRCHEDAQPEIRILAEKMYKAIQGWEPVVLKPGEWHLPYYEGNFGDGVWKPSGYGTLPTMEMADHKRGFTLNQAIKISASCCAQVSFRSNDDSPDKAERIYEKLVGDGAGPVHASPFEHQATPTKYTTVGDHAYTDTNDPYFPNTWEPGITHMDRKGNLWSGNFKGWVQNRQLIKNHVVW